MITIDESKKSNKDNKSNSKIKFYKSFSNIKKWVLRKCLFIGIDIFNNLVTFPSKIIFFNP